MDAFLHSFKCSNEAENDPYNCVRKHLTENAASSEGSTTPVSTYYSLCKQNTSQETLQSQENRNSLSASSFQNNKNHQLLDDVSSCKLNLCESDCFSSSNSLPTSFQGGEQSSLAMRQSFEDSAQTFATGSLNDRINKSPIFKQRLKLNNIPNVPYCGSVARTNSGYSNFHRHSGGLNLSRIITPRPPIHSNHGESITPRQHLIEPSHMTYNMMPESQFHSGLSAQPSLQHRESSFELQNRPQWHVPQQQLHNQSLKHDSSLVLNYECPNMEQLPVCATPYHRLFLSSQQRQPSIEPQNAGHFSGYQEPFPSQQMTPKQNNFLNPAQEKSQWPFQSSPNHFTLNNIGINSQEFKSPYCAKPGNYFFQYSQDSSSTQCQTRMIQSPIELPIIGQPCSTSSHSHEMQSNLSSHMTSPHPSDTSNVQQSDFLNTNVNRSLQSSQLIPSCQSEYHNNDSQLESYDDSKKMLPSCQVKLDAFPNTVKSGSVCSMKLEKDNANFHQKEVLKQFQNTEEDSPANELLESGRSNLNKEVATFPTPAKHNANSLEMVRPSMHSNKTKLKNTVSTKKSVSSKEKAASEIVGISAASRINPHSSITSIKAKSKLIIKSVEPSSSKNCIVSKIDTSTAYTKPVATLQTKGEIGVEKVYIKQNQQKNLIRPSKPQVIVDINIKKLMKRKQHKDLVLASENISHKDSVNHSSFVKLLGPNRLELVERKPVARVAGSNDNNVPVKNFLSSTVCKHCGVVQELKSALYCDRCRKPLFKSATKVKVSKKEANATKNITEKLTSLSESSEEKQDIILKLSKEQTEELKILSNNDMQLIKNNAKIRIETNSSERVGDKKLNMYDEPEIFILSSDDEDHALRKGQISKCEPQSIDVLEQDCGAQNMLEKNSFLSGGGLPFDEEWDQEDNFESVLATNIHVGNFEIKCDELNKKTFERVFFRKGQFQFEATAVNKGNEVEAEWLKINGEDIETIVCCFGESYPGSVMMVLMKSNTAKQIKKILGMTEESKFDFDPLSEDPTVKYIILKLHNLSEYVADAILSCFDINLIQIVDKEAMSNLLNGSLLEEEEEHEHPLQTLLIYPPPPCRGGITITTKDYYCLEEGQFLNDVILDFYLKYLVLEKLSKEDKERTHVFSTFFYKRLTSKPKTGKKNVLSEDNPVTSSAEIRHARVKSWTKDVDIFEKDFIIIPINERSHWFLAVICFPGLVLSTPASDTKGAEDSSGLSSRKSSKFVIPLIEDIEWSDKDEAESDDEEMVTTAEEAPQTKKPRMENDTESLHLEQKMQFIKRPCILIFDSLAGASRARIVATLRDYLTIEHFEKRKIRKVFSKDIIKGACLNVPQQTNFTDCGIFTLQFAESFFENPLKSFEFPIPSLKNWFDQERVSCKRDYIARKIEKLMNEFKPNHGIKLLKIIFKSAEEKTEKSCLEETNLTKGNLVISETKNNDSKVTSKPKSDSVESKKCQISKDDSEEIIFENIRPVSIGSLPRIPKRPSTPGPYRKPEPKYQTPLVGLYVEKDSVLQRNIDAKSISISGAILSPISSSKTLLESSAFKPKFASKTSHFSKPNSSKGGGNFHFRATSANQEGGGTKSSNEEDDVIFENEVLKPKLGYSPQKPIAIADAIPVKGVEFIESPFKPLSNKNPQTSSGSSSGQGNQLQTQSHQSVIVRKKPFEYNFYHQKNLQKR